MNYNFEEWLRVASTNNKVNEAYKAQSFTAVTDSFHAHISWYNLSSYSRCDSKGKSIHSQSKKMV